MLMSHMYDQNQFEPERGAVTRGVSSLWYVWCESGANKVLQLREYVDVITDDIDYVIIFANGAYAATHTERPLWKTLQEISKTFDVYVFPLYLTAKEYVAWDGSPESLNRFDGIKITVKKGKRNDENHNHEGKA